VLVFVITRDLVVWSGLWRLVWWSSVRVIAA
jgi:hypothetical protein